MERHRGHLESEADEEQAQREELHRRRGQRLSRDQAADFIEARAAGQAIGQRNPVQEKCARERAEQEVLQRRFSRRRRIAADSRQHVHRQRQHFERKKDHEQVRGRRHQHHACQREEHQGVVLAAGQPFTLDRRT